MTRKGIDELIQAKKAKGSEIQILSRALSSLYDNYKYDFNLVRCKTEDDGTFIKDENGDCVVEEIPDNELNSDNKALRDGYKMAIEDLCKLIEKI